MKAAAIVPISATVLLLSGCDSASKVVGTCGLDGADIEDCDRPDFGSCGNACCKVTATIDSSAADVAKALNVSLANGGADGYYALQPLFENVTGFTELGSSSSRFLGQVHHMTSGPAHFNDTLDFLVEASDDGKTMVTAFSLSLIAGVLGDAGQGYKNIAMAMKAANFGSKWDGVLSSQGGSCAPAKQGQQQEPEVSIASRRLSSGTVDGTCGLDGAKVQDCDHPDHGSCGNACCSLTVTVAQPADEVLATLNASFDDGGADGFYKKSMTYEKTLGFANLTGGVPESAPSAFRQGKAFIGQVIHTTNGKYHFDDVVNFNLVEAGDSETTITAFSNSLIGGAYGDAGQNYKNIKMAMDKAFGDSAKIAPGNFAGSCPAPSTVV